MVKEIAGIKLYTVPEISKALGVHPITVQTWVRTGKLPGRKIGVKWLVTEKALQEFLQGREQRKDKKRIR